MSVGTRTIGITAEQAMTMLCQMWSIRIFDSRVLDIWKERLIRGTAHPYIGEEAIAVGACAALRPDDFITSTHRGHGHCIAKGGDLKLMMAELMGKATGYCKGKGGSMHIADVEAGILGANGIVGGSFGIATGAALSAKLRGTEQVCVCFFGDGALNQGLLHECSNIAAIWKLPVIFVCENNQFAMSSRVEHFTSVPDPSIRAAAYGFPGRAVDGMDVIAVYEAVSEAVARARAGEGPSLIVATTYRYHGHHVADPLNYRDRSEVAEWQKKDAIERFKNYLIEQGVIDEKGAELIQSEIERAVEDAIEFAKSSPEPEIDQYAVDVYAD